MHIYGWVPDTVNKAAPPSTTPYLLQDMGPQNEPVHKGPHPGIVQVRLNHLAAQKVERRERIRWRNGS